MNELAIGSDRLRVMHLIDSLDPGGSERSLVELLPRLREVGIESSVVTLRPSTGGLTTELERAGFTVDVLGPGPVPVLVARLVGRLRRTRPDVVHTTLYTSNVVGRVAAALVRIPIVTSLVNTVYATAPAPPGVSPSKLRVARAVDRFTARHLTTGFHAVSDAVRRDAIAGLRLEATEVAVVPRERDTARLGEPSAERRARVRRTLDIEDSTRVVLAIARQEHTKGLDRLLRATHELMATRPDALVLVAGRAGNATPILESLHEQLQLGARCRFLGHRDDVGDLLAAADVVAVGSRHEGMPGAVLEAMAMGVPVVATDLPSNREVVDHEHTGLLVREDDNSAFARALDTLLADDDARRAMGAAARCRFEREFASGASASRLVDLFRAAASRRPLPKPTTLAADSDVHGVLVTFERPEQLVSTIAAVVDESQGVSTLTVVDNSPTSSARTAVAAVDDADVRYVAANENLGPAGGFALGVARVLPELHERDWVLFLDDDDPPYELGVISRLHAFADRLRESDPDVAAVGLVGARYNRLTGTTPKLRDDQLDGMVDVDVIGGNQLPLVSVAALRAVGAHDPELFYGFEELEFGLRLRAAGFRLVVNGDQWLARRHAQGRAGPDAPRALRRETPSRRYLSVRNQLVVARRYGSVTAPLAVTAANLLARPVMDLRRGRRPWRRYQLSTARGLVDGWLGRLGPRADASATDAGATR